MRDLDTRFSTLLDPPLVGELDDGELEHGAKRIRRRRRAGRALTAIAIVVALAGTALAVGTLDRTTRPVDHRPVDHVPTYRPHTRVIARFPGDIYAQILFEDTTQATPHNVAKVRQAVEGIRGVRRARFLADPSRLNYDLAAVNDRFPAARPRVATTWNEAWGLHVAQGRAPRTLGEIAVNSSAAAEAGIRLGATYSGTHPGNDFETFTATVTGIIDGSDPNLDGAVVVAEGTLAGEPPVYYGGGVLAIEVQPGENVKAVRRRFEQWRRTFNETRFRRPSGIVVYPLSRREIEDVTTLVATTPPALPGLPANTIVVQRGDWTTDPISQGGNRPRLDFIAPTGRRGAQLTGYAIVRGPKNLPSYMVPGAAFSAVPDGTLRVFGRSSETYSLSAAGLHPIPAPAPGEPSSTDRGGTATPGGAAARAAARSVTEHECATTLNDVTFLGPNTFTFSCFPAGEPVSTASFRDFIVDAYAPSGEQLPVPEGWEQLSSPVVAERSFEPSSGMLAVPVEASEGRLVSTAFIRRPSTKPEAILPVTHATPIGTGKFAALEDGWLVTVDLNGAKPRVTRIAHIGTSVTALRALPGGP
ncbi:MAG: hypothetical protein U0V73_08375 [Acidimicrobiia bacterium]